MLVRRVEERMKEQGISEFLLDTPVSNIAAIKFLTCLGYGTPVKQVYMTRNFAKKNAMPNTNIPIKNPAPKDYPIHHPEPENSSPLVKKHIAKNKLHAEKDITIRLMEISDIWPVYQIGERVFTATAVNLYRFWDEVMTKCQK